MLDQCEAVDLKIGEILYQPGARIRHVKLPDAEWQRWLPQLEPMEMPLGKVLYESGDKLTHVYFPSTSIVSLLYVMEDGASAEIAVARSASLR
jgi:hypothetical protein